MHERERHRIILNTVQEKPVATVQGMVELTGSSEATIRRDIAALHLQKKLRRVRGGAEALTPPQSSRLSGRPFAVNQGINTNLKRAIARRAAALCHDGEPVIINGGTTTYQMVHFLTGSQLQVFTNSFPIAEHLLKHSTHTVMMPGGTIYREQSIILSPFDNDVTRNFYARKMFMGAQGIGRLGLMETDPLLIQAEQKMFNQADELIVLVDSTKFAKRSSHIMCPLERITTIITDDGISAGDRRMVEEAGIDLVVTPVAAESGSEHVIGA